MHLDLAPIVAGRRRVFACHAATLTRRHAPNSLEAVAECVAAGAPRIEIDVRFLSDDGMLVFHDATFDHATDGAGSVSDLDTAAARRIRSHRAGTTLPLFEDVVDVLRHGSALLQVDLKPMLPLTPVQETRLATAMEPMRDRVLIGSQAHWNLRGLRERGFRVAFDPTLHWHAFAQGDAGEGRGPARRGLHGLWDDAPLALTPGVSSEQYFASRLEDLLGMLAASEWMVDYGTLLHMRAKGFPLGDVLAARGVELAAWTVHDHGPESTSALLLDLFSLGTTTVITDYAEQLAAYARAI